MRHRLVAGAVLAVSTWAAGARASADFPSIVQNHLMTPPIASIVGDAQGCLLCHLSEGGGLGTNNAFGTLMKNNGAVGGSDGTVIPALDRLAQSSPRAIADLQMGVNPNDDATALGNDPIPQYGCRETTGAVPRRVAGWLSGGGVLLGWALRARRRVRGRRRPPRGQSRHSPSRPPFEPPSH